MSNHRDLEPLAASYGIPFHHIAGDAGDQGRRRGADCSRWSSSLDIDLVVLARYMQVLSDDLCKELDGRAINIHHASCRASRARSPTTRPSSAA